MHEQGAFMSITQMIAQLLEALAVAVKSDLQHLPWLWPHPSPRQTRCLRLPWKYACPAVISPFLV